MVPNGHSVDTQPVLAQKRFRSLQITVSDEKSRDLDRESREELGLDWKRENSNLQSLPLPLQLWTSRWYRKWGLKVLEVKGTYEFNERY